MWLLPHQPEQPCLLITTDLKKIMPILDVQSQLSPPHRVFSHTKDNGLYSYATALWIMWPWLYKSTVLQYRCNDHFQSISLFPYFPISHFFISRSPFYKYPRPATWARDATVRSSGTRGSDRTHRANEIERGGKLDFDGPDGGWRLCFGLLLGARLRRSWM